MTDRVGRLSDRSGIDALARDIAERVTGMPAYLVDDETWAAALDEAEATYEPLPAKSPLQEAIDRARYPDPVKSIHALNAFNAALTRSATPEGSQRGQSGV